MNIHEYQAKELLAKYRRAGSGGLCRDERRRSGRGREKASRAAVGRQGADPRRRPRQGQVQGARRQRQGRRPPRPFDRRGARACRRDARQDSGDDPDRTARQAGPAALHHRRRRHRQGILSRAAGRPRERPDRGRRLDRRRDGDREGRPRHAGKDRDDHDRSGDGSDAASRPRSCGGAGTHRRSRKAGRQGAGEALRRVHRHRCLADRDQPAGGHRQGRAARARRQGRLRQQRRVPPPRPRAAARPLRRGPDGDRGVEVRPQLHQARRIDRLHGQRRRPRHGDDGHHQAGRRRAGQLPRRRRRRQQGKGHCGVQDHPERPRGEGNPRQHLRRDHALRHHRRGHRRCRARGVD